MRPMAILILLALSCTGWAEKYPLLTEHGCDWYDDMVIQKYVARTLGDMKDKDRTVSMDDLTEQLDRKFHAVKLPSLSPENMAQDKIYDSVKQSVVIIAFLYKCGKCSEWHVNLASGFVVHPDGIIATNYHVVESESDRTMGVMTHDGKMYAVQEVLAANEVNDTALIRIEARKLSALPIRADAPVGTAVSVISHPDEKLYMMTRGIISRYTTRHRRGQTWMNITADYAKGSSGGPVVDDTGAVVGMVASTHSIYYNKEEGQDANLQMVVKSCVPARNLLKLCRSEYKD